MICPNLILKSFSIYFESIFAEILFKKYFNKIRERKKDENIIYF